jgi:hypothetical protein
MAMMALPALGAAGGAMGGIGTAFTVLSSVMGLASGMAQARATIAAGQAQKQQHDAMAQQHEFQKKQYIARGKMERAQHGLKQAQARREREYYMSRAQNQSSGGGFMGQDHSSRLNMASLMRYGTYKELNYGAGGEAAQWDNTVAARGRAYSAGAERMAGMAAVTGAKNAARGTMMASFGSFAKSLGGIRYG